MTMPKNNQEAKSKQELIEKWESAIEAAEFYGKGKEERLISYMEDFVSDLNQLDEPEVTEEQAWDLLSNIYNIPNTRFIREAMKVVAYYVEDDTKIRELREKINSEVLSQEWIDKHAETIFDLDEDFETEFIKVDDLQNIIVPKQEDLEAKIQELIKVYKQEDGAYSNPENGWIGGFIDDLENLVEEKQKFYVLNSEGETMIRKNDSGIRTSSGFKIRNGFEGENYKFTEQEIKDYDERYWPFAVKVEEVEE